MKQGSWRSRARGIGVATVLLTGALVASATPALAAGGPVVLMGIDAEDGGIGGHGPLANYQSVVTDLLGKVTNGGTGLVVFGGGKNGADNVTQFWTALASGAGVSVTFVNGSAAIAAQSLGGRAAMAVVSSVSGTSSGGLTQAEADALAARQADIASFVNGGGGLIAFSQDGLRNPYGFISGLGTFTFNTGASYSNITPTAAGQSVGVTNALDVCCWHDEYLTFPSFLQVLATNAATGRAAALGGEAVIIGGGPCTVSAARPPAGYNVITGTEGPDRLLGTSGPDVIFGLGGNDQIAGMAGDDILVGGPGDDSLAGGDGNDALCGGDGRDYVSGGAGNDSAFGDAGNDDLAGGEGNDELDGGTGDDRLAGGAGQNTLRGGGGSDSCTGPPASVVPCPV